MKFTTGSAATLLSLASLVSAQTYTDCNPLKQSCPPDPALAGTASFDFVTEGPSDRFSSVGPISYDKTNGGVYTISKHGDAPTISSKFYIMFGHVEFVVKASQGTGIVSSAIMQSDCLDEIDFEWLGGDNAQVQTNYFRQGQTGNYDREQYVPVAGNHDAFHTYAIDWTSERIQWLVDGKVVRTLTPADSKNQYPQTPMMIKVGSWAGGDPANSQGTIEWAGGQTDFNAGPFVMYVKSVDVTDYSTGDSYSYSGSSGNWDTIKSNGGQIKGQGTPGSGAQVESSAPPAETSGPTPTQGIQPTDFPWVPLSSTMSESESTGVTSFAGLPSGWVTESTGKPSAPSTATETPPSSSSSSPSSPASSSAGGSDSSSSSGSDPSQSSGFATTTAPGQGGPSASGNPSSTVAPPNAANGNSRIQYGAVVLCGFVASLVLA